VEILAFDEPPDYLPKRAWLGQFSGKRLDDELSVKRGIRGITGATLSSQAVTDAVRRVLAIHEALR
jgi:Na+-translocating ferredoxin:NAD+ oxidoreductase RnfG subunit